MSSPTVSPTRQQLEELDTLLQRMLSLPVNSMETETTPIPPPPVPPVAPPPVAAYSFPAPAVARPAAPRPVALRPAAPARPAPALPRRSVEVSPGDHSWNVPLAATPPGVSVYGQWPGGTDPLSAAARPVLPPPAPPAPSSSPAATMRVATIPSPDEQNHSRGTPPPMQRLRVEPGVAEAPAAQTHPDSAPIPVHLWPLAALDWTLGKSLGLVFGKPGRWFGQGSGKVVIGWCGVLMLCGAIAWGCVDYFGLSW
jgi:hypothetical protein